MRSTRASHHRGRPTPRRSRSHRPVRCRRVVALPRKHQQHGYGQEIRLPVTVRRFDRDRLKPCIVQALDHPRWCSANSPPYLGLLFRCQLREPCQRTLRSWAAMRSRISFTSREATPTSSGVQAPDSAPRDSWPPRSGDMGGLLPGASMAVRDQLLRRPPTNFQASGVREPARQSLMPSPMRNGLTPYAMALASPLATGMFSSWASQRAPIT